MEKLQPDSLINLQPYSYVMKVLAIFTPKKKEKEKERERERERKRERGRSKGYHLSPFRLCQIAKIAFGKFLIFTF